MDSNHDNRLTLEEFREGSKADPRIVQVHSFVGISCMYFVQLHNSHRVQEKDLLRRFYQ